MRRLMLTTLAAALVLTACGGGLDEDEALADQLDGDDRSEAIEGVVEGAGGVLTESEATCWVDEILASGATPADLNEFGENPLGLVSADMVGMLTGCIDPSIEVDAPLAGDVRDQLTDGFVAGGVTPASAECIIEGLEAQGFDARDITVAGWMEDMNAPVMAAIGQLAITC
jgi:hypothetical protein